MKKCRVMNTNLFLVMTKCDYGHSIWKRVMMGFGDEHRVTTIGLLLRPLDRRPQQLIWQCVAMLSVGSSVRGYCVGPLNFRRVRKGREGSWKVFRRVEKGLEELCELLEGPERLRRIMEDLQEGREKSCRIM